MQIVKRVSGSDGSPARIFFKTICWHCHQIILLWGFVILVVNGTTRPLLTVCSLAGFKLHVESNQCIISSCFFQPTSRTTLRIEQYHRGLAAL